MLPLNLRLSSVFAILVYALSALIILQRAGRLRSLPKWLINSGIWALALYFTLGIVMNGLSRSPSERLVMTPVNLVLAACCWALALRKSQR